MQLGDNTKYALFGAFENEATYHAFRDHEKVKAFREKFKKEHKGDWVLKQFRVLY